MIEKKQKRKRTKKKGGRYKRGEYSSIKSGQTCKFRSGWEKVYMEHLDADPDVSTWQYESFSIDYVSNKRTGKIRRYIPDFRVEYTDGSIEIVEIKPSRKLQKPTVQKKLLAAQVWCADHGAILRIMTEIELKAIGVL